MCPEEALPVPLLGTGLCPGQDCGLLYLVLKAKPQVCPLLCKHGNFIQSVRPRLLGVAEILSLSSVLVLGYMTLGKDLTSLNPNLLLPKGEGAESTLPVHLAKKWGGSNEVRHATEP